MNDVEIVDPNMEDTSIEILESVRDDEDNHMNELTARDHACIHLRVPESTKSWLNDLIKKSLKHK
jgi:disulfide oxidoreductase YuzD